MIFNLATLVIAFMAFTASAQPEPNGQVILFTGGTCNTTGITKIYLPQDIGDSGCVSNCLSVLNADAIQVFNNTAKERTTCYIWQDENCGLPNIYYTSVNSDEPCQSLPIEGGVPLSMKCFAGLC